MKHIILGGGCFWCTQSVFSSLKGVQSVISGYAGGTADTANYKTICTGQTKHIEVIDIAFDDAIIDLSVILDVFFATHDPTTLNRQGDDIGTQYASVIFYTDDDQLDIINHKIHALKADGVAVVTQVHPAPTFYRAEDYHQDYYLNNPNQPYCNLAIPPKLAKLRANFSQYLK